MEGHTIPARVETADEPEARTSTGHRYCACGCGGVVETHSRSVRYASAACAERARIAKRDARCAAYYEASHAQHNWTRYLRARGLLTDARRVILDGWRGLGRMAPADARKALGLPPAKAAVPPDPAWRLAAPARDGHLPGTGPCALSLRGMERRDVRVGMGDVRALHGLLTALHGADHHPTDPAWSLAPSSAGWAVTWRDARGAGLSDVVRRVTWRGAPVLLVIEPGPPIAWPRVRTGRHRVELGTITPVSIRRTLREGGRKPGCGRPVGSVARTDLTADTLVSGLLSLAEWVGHDVAREALRVVVVSHETDPASVRVDRSGRVGDDRGRVRGWEGRCVLEVNAPALWLLEIAAAGWGLGGKTAFGFGAVRVREAGE